MPRLLPPLALLVPSGFVWFALAGCADAYQAPFARATPPSSPPSSVAGAPGPGRAALVVLWPMQSCDPPGYFTLATADGRFVGTIRRGSELRTTVDAGRTSLVAWNDVMETSTGTINPENVAVLHADLREGHTYYVRMLMGEWGEHGPPVPGLHSGTWTTQGGRVAGQRCLSNADGTPSAMIAVGRDTDELRDVSALETDLAILVPDRTGGQAWLDAHRPLLDSHAAAGEERYASLRPDVRAQATIGPTAVPR